MQVALTLQEQLEVLNQRAVGESCLSQRAKYLQDPL